MLDNNLAIIEDNIAFYSMSWFNDKYIILTFNNGEEMIYDCEFNPILQNSFDRITIASVQLYTLETDRFAAQNGDCIYIFSSDGTEEYSFKTDYGLSNMIQGKEKDIFIVYNIDNDNLKYMLMNSNGELINEQKYDDINVLPSSGKDLIYDFFLVEINGLCGVINYNTGEYIVPIEYETVEWISNGYFLAHKSNGESIVMNLQGEKLFSGVYQGFYEYLLSEKKVSENETLYGITDINGNIILPTEYKSIIERFNDSLTKVIRYEVVREDGKTGVVDTHGEEIIPVEYDEIIQVSDTEYAVKQEEAWALINTHGEIQIPFGTFDKIKAGNEKNHLIKVQKGNQFGYADNKGNWVICFQDGESKY